MAGDGGIEPTPDGRTLAGQVGLGSSGIEQGEEVEVRSVGRDEAEGARRAAAVPHITHEIGERGPGLHFEQGGEGVKGPLQRHVHVHQAMDGQDQQAGVVGRRQGGEDEVLRLITGVGGGRGAQLLITVGKSRLVAVVAVGDVQSLS